MCSHEKIFVGAQLPKAVIHPHDLHVGGEARAVGLRDCTPDREQRRHWCGEIVHQGDRQIFSEKAIRCAERELRAAEARERLLFEGVADGVAHRERADQDTAGQRRAGKNAESSAPIKSETAQDQADDAHYNFASTSEPSRIS
jgi:hypothetical protein